MDGETQCRACNDAAADAAREQIARLETQLAEMREHLGVTGEFVCPADAACAALREALETCLREIGCVGCVIGTREDEALGRAQLAAMRALATDAGKAMLERVRRAEAELTAERSVRGADTCAYCLTPLGLPSGAADGAERAKTHAAQARVRELEELVRGYRDDHDIGAKLSFDQEDSAPCQCGLCGHAEALEVKP